MKILLNGEAQSVDISSLDELLKSYKKQIAVSINEQIIPKSAWKNTKVNENDKIEIIELVGGG